MLAGSSTTLDQTRTHTKLNEIEEIDDSTATVSYDDAGNMTTMPKVGDWTTGQTLTWDAWSRLITIAEGTTTIAAYAYDGMMRRISKQTILGAGAETRDFYYSKQWQILEERVNGGSTADRQFVWGLRYADDLILRDRFGSSSGGSSSSSGGGASSSSGGVGTARLYAFHDQWHVTGVSDHAAVVQERYAYEAFGGLVVLSGSFGFAPVRSSTGNAYLGRTILTERPSYIMRVLGRCIHLLAGGCRQTPQMLTAHFSCMLAIIRRIMPTRVGSETFEECLQKCRDLYDRNTGLCEQARDAATQDASDVYHAGLRAVDRQRAGNEAFCRRLTKKLELIIVCERGLSKLEEREDNALWATWKQVTAGIWIAYAACMATAYAAWEICTDRCCQPEVHIYPPVT